MTQTDKAKKALANVKVRPMSPEVVEIRKNINMIQEAMAATMKKDVHFGVIPGCGKPSLYKAGAETLIALFKLTFKPEVTSTAQDGEVQYLVRMDLSTRDGVFVGSGIGECSSGEEKYMWRSAICEEEFECSPEHMRRIKFKKNKYKAGEIEKIQQVRVHPSDLANTILKMAKKRALIDAVLTATSASDIFSQDLEELPEGFIHDEKLDSETEHPKEQEQSRAGDVISDAQRKRLFAIAMEAGMEKDKFKEWLSWTFQYESSKDILKSDYEKICKEAKNYRESS